MIQHLYKDKCAPFSFFTSLNFSFHFNPRLYPLYLTKISTPHQLQTHHILAKMVEFTVFKGTAEGKIVEAKTTRTIGRNDVLIKVTHSGLCGTDEHYKKACIGLGHEGAGIVEVSPLPKLVLDSV